MADADRKRYVVLCRSCEPYVEDGVLQNPERTRLCDYAVDPVEVCGERVRERWQDHTADVRDEAAGAPPQREYILGRSIQDFASAVAALNDGEEMVLSLVHPLCQVYTIPKTGQLAYVGHVCNFRQKVTKFLSSLPTLPCNMPFVRVRPRSFGGRPSLKAPFTVDVVKLRHAFLWLKANNPYYHDVEWREYWAEEWKREDVEIGTTREEEMVDGRSLTVTPESFDVWMQHALRERESGTGGFSMGDRLLALCESARDPGDESFGDWNRLRAMVATALDSPFKRAAGSVSRDDVAAVLYDHGAIDLDGLTETDTKAVWTALAVFLPADLPAELHQLHTEMDTILCELAEEACVESAGAVSASDVADDVGLRIGVLQGAADAVAQTFDQNKAPVRDIRNDPQPGFASASGGQKARGYPRVDAPEVDGAAAMAIREDTRGYIAQAFPKLFPFGIADFHDGQGGRTAPGSPHRMLNFSS